MANLLGTLITGNLRTTQGYGTSDSTRILYPEGGAFVTTTAVITGAIRIKMPVFGSGMMMTCTVKVYEYSSNKSFTITFGGHRDSDNWYNIFCYFDGDGNRGDLPVRFGLDDGVNCVWIGETSNQWSYPQVFVTDVQMGYVGYSTTWLSGWSVGFVTSFGTVNRTATAFQKITTTNIGSQSVSFATSSGTFSTNWTNYKGVTENAVAGQLMWKNYGNNHTIFDASNSTSPTGSGVNNANPDFSWAGTYPTLMGWNGANTYGVRVDSSRIADSIISQANSATITAATAATANTIVLRDSAGDIYSRYSFSSYVNTSDNDESSITRFIIKNGDNYHRSATTTVAADIIKGAASGTWAINVTGSAGSITNGVYTTQSINNLTGVLNFGVNNATPYNDATGVSNGIAFGGIESSSLRTYGIFTELENIGGNYSKLTLNYHTGIRIGASLSYGGTRFYNNFAGGSGGGSEIFSVGNGDNNVRVVNTLFIGGNTAIHAGNIGSQSVNYATTAGNAATATNVAYSGLTGTVPTWNQNTTGTASNANHLNTTRDTPSNSLQYWQSSGLDINEAPSGDWHNTIRMGHGSPLSYYSNTLAIRMTGSGVGDIYTQTIMDGNRQGWKKHWNDSNLTNLNQLTNGPGYVTSSGTVAFANQLTVVGAGATVINANTFQTGILTNYYSTAAISNIPEQGYGSLYNFGGYDNTTLSLQLFSVINHNSTTPTRELYFRMGNNLGFANDWRTIVDSRNIGSQSVANADTVDGLHETAFLRVSANSNSPLNGTFAIGSASGRNFIQSHSGQPLDINPLGNAVTVGSNLTVSGNVIASVDMRAPIFYDSNDTAYYGDFASESNLYRFTSASMTRNAMNYLSINSPFVTRSQQTRPYQNGTMGWGNVDFNTIFSNWGSGFIDTWGSVANAPGGSGHYVGLQGFHHNHEDGRNAYGFQMACAGEADNRFFWRSAWPTLRGWVEMIHSGTIGNQSVAFASNAGNANSITNAVGGAYTWTGINYFTTNQGGYCGSTNSGKMQAYSDSNNSAFFSWHKGNHFATNMGLDADNVIRIGGWSAASNRWQLDMSGNMTVAGDVTAYSDARVKTNVKTIESALKKTLKLRGVSYNRTDSNDKSNKIGVIAQEILEVVPEVVNQDNDGMYNVSYGNITALLIEAIKEQQKQIDELKSKLDGLTK